jgi:two-component system nitrogen regulation response regulator GlnG
VPGDTTLRPTPVATAPAREELWLTILWHPERARVGQSVRVTDRMRLSRLEPQFSAPASRDKAPLGDRHISRTPVMFSVSAEALTMSGPDLVVDGQQADAQVALASEALRRGVLIELAERVVLWLQRRTEPSAPDGLLGCSTALDAVRRIACELARVDHPVLIVGETGAGKERVARLLHERGDRAAGPFVAINMATMTASTAPAQLFGHVRGAFTGADRSAPGLFERADGGTLFLDEVLDTPAETQAMLLRALDDGEILPVGADAPHRVSVRVVAATDADTTDDQFRPQLYQRLAGHTISVPPLRDRREDVGPLLAHFLGEEASEAEVPASLVRAWMGYAWPGNVREVRNLARRWAVASRSGVALERPPQAGAKHEAAPELDDDRLLATLEAHDWAPGAAARALGVSKTTVYAWIERSPRVRKARDVSPDELEQAMRATDRDPERAARLLKVSHRGLQLRLRELEHK